MISVQKPIRYPTSDGRPMAETDVHRIQMMTAISALEMRYADDPNIYVSGNLLLYYVPENKRRHVSPDVFVVKGVAKKVRDYYLVWDEGKTPDAIIEITSKSKRKEDTVKKYQLYRDVLKVREYFLFDPRGDYLKPNLQGFRLSRGEYMPINPVTGRLPSQVLGLHLEDNSVELRFWDPKTGKWLPTSKEQATTLTQLERDFKELRAELDTLKRKIGRQASQTPEIERRRSTPASKNESHANNSRIARPPCAAATGRPERSCTGMSGSMPRHS